MASESVDGMSEDLRQWVERRAEATGQSPEAVLARAVAAYRFLEGEADVLGDAPASVGAEFDADGADLETLERRVEALERRVEAGDGDAASVGDRDGSTPGTSAAVRDRLDALTAAVEGAADADHGHPDLREGLSEALEAATEARDRVRTLDDRVSDGFENYEEILEYLTDVTDDVEGKLRRLAGAITALRSDVVDVEAAAAERAAAASLQEAANRHGETRARCGDCRETVELALLSSPRCPHCESTFDGFEPGRGLFSSPELTVGSRPALEGDVESVADPGDLFDGNDPDDGSRGSDGGSNAENAENVENAANANAGASPAPDGGE